MWRAELSRLNNILVSLQQGGLGLYVRAKPYLGLVDGIMSSTGTPGGTGDRPGGVFELTSSSYVNDSMVDNNPSGRNGSIGSANASLQSHAKQKNQVSTIPSHASSQNHHQNAISGSLSPGINNKGMIII